MTFKFFKISQFLSNPENCYLNEKIIVLLRKSDHQKCEKFEVPFFVEFPVNSTEILKKDDRTKCHQVLIECGQNTAFF